jgi:hypothetical protein
MRFLIREMEYEKPVASGILRYEQEGVPTGLEEAWRYSSALDGYHFLRVEVDTKDPRKQETYLYHLVLNPDREIERLKFRTFGSKTEISGDVQFDDEIISLHRIMLNKSQNMEHKQLDEIPRESGAVLTVPSIAVLSLAASRVVEDGCVPMIALESDTSFSVQIDSACFTWGKEEEREILRNTLAVRPCSIRWNLKETRLWLDKAFWPVSASLSGGLSAIEVAYWRYQSAAKSKPKVS